MNDDDDMRALLCALSIASMVSFEIGAPSDAVLSMTESLLDAAFGPVELSAIVAPRLRENLTRPKLGICGDEELFELLELPRTAQLISGRDGRMRRVCPHVRVPGWRMAGNITADGSAVIVPGVELRDGCVKNVCVSHAGFGPVGCKLG